jgi:hypothetical protein
MYVLQLLNYIRPYGNQTNEDATDGACDTYVGEEKLFERLVEREFYLHVTVHRERKMKRETNKMQLIWGFILKWLRIKHQISCVLLLDLRDLK